MKLPRRVRHILSFLGIVSLLALIIFLAGQANSSIGSLKCERLNVRIMNADSSQFVTSKHIIDELVRTHLDPRKQRISDINTQDIEHALLKMSTIEDAECVICNGNEVVIYVNQFVPVMRVFSGELSYYVNRTGKRSESSSRFLADVPIVVGKFTDSFPPSTMLPLIEYVQNDKKLRDLVSMYKVDDKNNVFLVPCITGHVINIGPVADLKNKFAKLDLFYSKVIPDKGWDYYDTISVKFTHQVVATRRNKAVKHTVEWSEEIDEHVPDIQTMTTNDATAAITPSAQDTKKESETKQPANQPSQQSTKTDAADKVKNAFKQN